MTPRIGVGVGADALRLVYVRRGRVRWSGEMDFEGADTLERALPELLRQSPLPRWPRPVVTVAVGPFATQLKRVTGLPPLSDPRLTASLIRENQSRFFMRNGQPLLTTGVRTIEDGAAWVGSRPCGPAVRGAGSRRYRKSRYTSGPSIVAAKLIFVAGPKKTKEGFRSAPSYPIRIKNYPHQGIPDR